MRGNSDRKDHSACLVALPSPPGDRGRRFRQRTKIHPYETSARLHFKDLLPINSQVSMRDTDPGLETTKGSTHAKTTFR